MHNRYQTISLPASVWLHGFCIKKKQDGCAVITHLNLTQHYKNWGVRKYTSGVHNINTVKNEINTNGVKINTNGVCRVCPSL